MGSNKKAKKEILRPVTGVMKKNLMLVFLLILVFSVILVIRLIYLNNVNGDKYAKAVLSQQSYSSSVIHAERGNILDRNGLVLARSEKLYNCIIDPAVILSHDYYVEPTIEAAVSYLGYDYNELKQKINDNKDSSYVVYEKNVEYSRVSEYKAFADTQKFVVGIWFEEEFTRSYPYGSLASHVIGFTTSDGVGAYGVEASYNDELTGTDGQTFGYFDSELNKQRTVKEAENGKDIVTTIDYNIQTVVEDNVRKFTEEIGSNNIGVIVMNPNNAEIYAMASNSEYDLNNPRSLAGIVPEEELAVMDDSQKLETLYALWRNFCVSDSYEPGSTYKTITVASALEEDIVYSGSSFECLGYKEIGGWRIGCNNKYGHGTISLAEALMKSCNCALMDIAEQLGRDFFFEYQRRFGFGKKTGIDLPGEASGIVIDLKNLNETELATSSFGTTFNVTMVQMAAAYASILNGGTYHTPHVMLETRNASGSLASVYNNAVVTRTVSTSTSDFIRDALYMTVEAGTATPAKVGGYLIGGKTGTAQKRPRDEKKYVVSFVGFAPVNDPQVMIYIVMDEIHDEELAGSSSPATKMSAAIMKEILPYLGLYPDGDIEYNYDLSLYIDDSNDFYHPEEDEMNPDVLPDMD